MKLTTIPPKKGDSLWCYDLENFKAVEYKVDWIYPRPDKEKCWTSYVRLKRVDNGEIRHESMSLDSFRLGDWGFSEMGCRMHQPLVLRRKRDQLRKEAEKLLGEADNLEKKRIEAVKTLNIQRVTVNGEVIYQKKAD